MQRAWLQVAGLERSAADVRLPSQLYAVGVTAPLVAGDVLSVDTAAAEKCPGVVAVLTAESTLLDDTKQYAPLLRELFSSSIRHAGQLIALVVAESRSAAIEAAHKIEVRARAKNACLTIAAALSTGATQPSVRSQSGAAVEAFADSKTRFVQTYRMGPRLAGSFADGVATAVWRDDGLTLFTVGNPTEELLAKLALRREQLLIVPSSVGADLPVSGPQVLLAAIAARQLRRPVQVMVSALTAAGVLGEQVHAVQMGLGDGDRPSALLLRVAIGGSSLTGDALVAASALASLYGFSARELSCVAAQVQLPVTPPQLDGFAIDAAIDELAVQLATDPISLRLRWLDGNETPAAKALRACLSALKQRMPSGEPRAIGVATAIHCLKSGDLIVGAHLIEASVHTGRPRLVRHIWAVGVGALVEESVTKPRILRRLERARRLAMRRELTTQARAGWSAQHIEDSGDASEVQVCDIVLVHTDLDALPSVSAEAIEAMSDSGVAAAMLSALSLALGERPRGLPWVWQTVRGPFS